MSVTVRHGMPHWPDDLPIVFERATDIAAGDTCNLSHVTMGVHTGTHMDAPVHFPHGSLGLDTMPPSATIGEVRIIEISDPVQVSAQELSGYALKLGERTLLRTENSVRCWRQDTFVIEVLRAGANRAQGPISVKLCEISPREIRNLCKPPKRWIEAKVLTSAQAGLSDGILAPTRVGHRNLTADGCPRA